MGSRSNIILRKIAVPALIPESVTDRSECAERVFSALHSLDYCIKNEPNNPLIRAQIVGDLVSDPIFHGLTADELNATVQSAVDRFVRMDPHRTYQSILFELFSSAFKSTIPGSAQPPWLDFDLFSGHLPRFYPIKSVNTEWAAYRHSSSSKTLSVKKTLIGHGSYQRVYQGLLWNEHTSIRVAVKMATINTLASDDPMETWAHSMLMLYNEQRILHYLHAQNSPYAVVPHLIGISALPGPRSVYKANYLNQLSLRFMSAVTMVDTTLSDYIPRVLNSKKDLLKSCFSSAIRAIIGIHTHHVFIGDCSVTNMGLQNTGSRKTIRIFDFNLATVTAGIQNPILGPGSQVMEIVGGTFPVPEIGLLHQNPKMAFSEFPYPIELADFFSFGMSALFELSSGDPSSYYADYVHIVRNSESEENDRLEGLKNFTTHFTNIRSWHRIFFAAIRPNWRERASGSGLLKLMDNPDSGKYETWGDVADRWKASQAQNRSKYLKAAVLYQELDLIKIQSARFAKNRSESVEIDIEQQIPDSRCLCSIL